MWRKNLREHGIEYVECGGVKSNPTISKVREAVAIAKAFGADSVLSIGGGSCLDSAKAIAAGACYDGDTWDFFKGTLVQKALMIFDVITLAATGSEMNWAQSLPMKKHSKIFDSQQINYSQKYQSLIRNYKTTSQYVTI